MATNPRTPAAPAESSPRPPADQTAPEDPDDRDEGGVAAPPPQREPAGAPTSLIRAGRIAWALVGILALVVIAGVVAGQLTLVVVPLVLALFPAALLEPVARALKRVGAPPALASIATILGAVLVVVALFAVVVPAFVAELPELAESFGAGAGELLEAVPVDLDAGELLERAGEMAGEAGEMAGTAVEAATTVFEVVAGFLLAVVALFFYLKDGSRIAAGIRDLLPGRARHHATEMAGRVWTTLGRYFRGQLLVAFVDAVLIGLGLLILGIPLALPLAVLIFFGGLFPIVGAVATGAVAVVVALADAGLTRALVVLALVIAVQQLESNVLEPVVLGKAIALHPLMVLVAITAGAVTLGVLGAFLAVPVAAGIARVVDYLRGREGEEGDADEEEEEPPPVTVMASSS